LYSVINSSHEEHSEEPIEEGNEEAVLNVPSVFGIPHLMGTPVLHILLA